MAITNKQALQSQLAPLKALTGKLSLARTDEERLALLDAEVSVLPFIAARPLLEAFFTCLDPACQVALKAVIAVGQGERVLRIPEELEDKADRLRVLLGQLLEVERFYDTMGGIVGYHTAVISLLCEEQAPEQTHYFHPPGSDLTHPSPELNQAVLAGLEGLPELAEIYPVGGAGDRLGLIDLDTNGALPAACLDYCGWSLLEGMVRDLQGREYLYFRLFGKRLITPLALMTSEEKHNHLYISSICEEAGYFGRPRESFLFFTQCLVPQITEEGDWVVSAPLELACKPGGHGALWKLMEDKGVFDWLKTQKRRKALIRQINNPVAGTDTTLLAFTGTGLGQDRAFGFSACQRKVGSAEGCDVLFEREEGDQTLYGLSNIEYCEFAKHGIEDAPKSEGSPYSKFPSNTNILFADLDTVREVTRHHPIPGMLINMKKQAKSLNEEGEIEERYAGRLESTMQNIADKITSTERENLPSYLVFTERQKTISVTKKCWSEGEDPHETPPGAYADLLHNTHELLAHHCKIEMPSPPIDQEVCLGKVPFHILYHPALGPTFGVISQKLQGGRIAHGSELILEIAELSWANVTLDGSLHIIATSPLGEGDHTGGKAIFHNCTITNAGVDHEADNTYWQNRIKRRESLQIEIEGEGEFVAEGIHFTGPQKIVVPNGTRVTARMDKGELVLEKGDLDTPQPLWAYRVGGDRALHLTRLARQPLLA